MNQINGYCQIELPDRIGLDAVTSAGVTLTDAEVKPIIKALNLDQVLVDDDYSSYINAWLNKPIIVKAYTASDATKRDVKSIFHASTISTMKVGGTLSIELSYQDIDDKLKYIMISLDYDNGEQSGERAHWNIEIIAARITTTDIA